MGVKITVVEDEVTCGLGDIVVVLFGKIQPATQRTEIFSSPIAQLPVTLTRLTCVPAHP